MALDPVVVASKQYSVVVDNDRVRALKMVYGPHERGAMHSHPASVLVCLTEFDGTFTYPDGRSEPVKVAAGESALMPATTHQPANKTGNTFEGYLIELKD